MHMANPNKINKDQLLERIAAKANISKKEAEDVMQAFEDVVIEAMKNGKEAVLTGFGSFLARTRESRMGVNPQNPTERIRIPTVTVPKFKAGKTLKDALKEKDDTSNQSAQSATPNVPHSTQTIPIPVKTDQPM